MTVLTHPLTAVIGSTDPAKLAAFLCLFGAQPVARPVLDADAAQELYGLSESLEQIVLETPGADGSIRLIHTPHAAPDFEPLTVGPYGVDFFSRDLELSLQMLRSAGAKNFSDLVRYGPEGSVAGNVGDDYDSTELLFQAPYDELSIFLTDTRVTRNPWPTLLDRDPTRVHSELLMLVWVIEDPQIAREFWGGEAGLVKVADNFPEFDPMRRLMFHPDNIPMHALNWSDAERGRKIELLSYPETPTTQRPSWPLHGGLHAAGFTVDSVGATMAALPSATFGEVVTADDGYGRRAVVSGLAPDGVRFELWERPRI